MVAAAVHSDDYERLAGDGPPLALVPCRFSNGRCNAPTGFGAGLSFPDGDTYVNRHSMRLT